MNLAKLTTELRNEKSSDIDLMSSKEIAKLMNDEDYKVVQAVNGCLDEIAAAIDCAYEAFMNDGKIFYIGAGTSGRIGVLDAVELLPTFSVGNDRVIALIAGGNKAFIKAVEGAEDSKELCVKDLSENNLSKNDVVIGIAASGRTPYVIGGLEYANKIGAKTIALSCNKNSEISKHAKIIIECVNGPEVVTGSTRLKSGTATKMILNMISTGMMVKAGKVYHNLMVDVIQTNEKLVRRAENIVMEATNVTREEARHYIDAADKSCKVAIAMILLGCSKVEAIERLKKAQGNIRKIKK